MNNRVKNMTYCSVLVVIVVIMSQIKIDLPTLVPITLQTLGIYLIGCLLNPKLSLITTLLYIFMGAIGLPVFSGFGSGLGILFGPTGGYIFSFPLVALIISLIVKQKNNYYIKIIAMIIATSICYFIGTIWFVFYTKINFIDALFICVIPFLIGDTIKVVLAATISSKIKKIN